MLIDKRSHLLFIDSLRGNIKMLDMYSIARGEGIHRQYYSERCKNVKITYLEII